MTNALADFERTGARTYYTAPIKALVSEKFFALCEQFGASNVGMITGDSGNGMTHCTAGAILVSDLILGRPNPWTELYAPSRQPFHGVARHDRALGPA